VELYLHQHIRDHASFLSQAKSQITLIIILSPVPAREDFIDLLFYATMQDFKDTKLLRFHLNMHPEKFKSSGKRY